MAPPDVTALTRWRVRRFWIRSPVAVSNSPTPSPRLAAIQRPSRLNVSGVARNSPRFSPNPVFASARTSRHVAVSIRVTEPDPAIAFTREARSLPSGLNATPPMPNPSADGSFFSSRPVAISNTLSQLCRPASFPPRSTNFATIRRLSGLKLRSVGLDRLPASLNDSTS